MANYKFYILKENDKLTSFMEDIQKERDDNINLISEFMRKHSCEEDSFFINENGKVVEIWKPKDKTLWKVAGKGFVPKRNTKEGRTLYTEFNSLPPIITSRLAILKFVGIDPLNFTVCDGFKAVFPNAAYSCKHRTGFLKLPHQHKHIITDFVEVKEWEFLKEVEECTV